MKKQNGSAGNRQYNRATEVRNVVDQVHNSKEAQRRNVVEKTWLNHYNQILLEKGLITEAQYRKMKVRISSRKPAA